MRALVVPPHIAQNISGRSSAVDGRTTPHAGYAVSQRKRKRMVSQRKRKRIEEPFGRARRSADLRGPCFGREARLQVKFTLTMAGYNLIRLPKLIAAQA